MKTSSVASVFLLCLVCSPLAAHEAPPLGEYHFYFEYSAMIMQHVTFESDDAGIHLGLAGYKHVGSSWYVGAELGVGESLVLFGDDSSITMCELNGKRVFALGRDFRCDLGAGLSYNRVSYDGTSFFSTEHDFEIDDWVLGAQALANVHLKLGGFILGAHMKYMLTEDVAGVQELEDLEKGWDYSNVTIGLQVGFLIH